MKFTTTQEALQKAIAMVSKAVPNRPSHPILANILVIADCSTQSIRLTGFDLALGITTTQECSVEESGEVTIPAKLVNDIVSRLPNSEIIFVTEEDDPTSVTLICQTGQYRVRGCIAGEYPELPSLSSGNSVVMPATVLRQGIYGVLFAASADESKQVLTGVRIRQNLDSTEFAATDGHRLGMVEIPLEEGANAGVEFAITIPSKALREVERLLHADEQVAIAFDEHLFIAEQGAHRIVSRLLEGQYPNYRQLIPPSFQREFTADRKQFMAALERVAVLADPKNNVIKLTAKSAEIVVSAEVADVGSGTEAIPAQMTGEAIEIAFNVRFLLEAMKVMVSEDILFRINSPTSPAILMPLNGTKMIQLLMPIQIRA